MNDEENTPTDEDIAKMREEYERELFALPDARTIEYWERLEQ